MVSNNLPKINTHDSSIQQTLIKNTHTQTHTQNPTNIIQLNSNIQLLNIKTYITHHNKFNI